MSVKFEDGHFRVVVCENGHVMLQVLDGSAGVEPGKLLVKFCAVMSRVEAAELAADLMEAAAPA